MANREDDMKVVPYQAFVLHDGEDDKRTDELHKFLEPFNDDWANEWEGNGSGIVLYLRVSPGDAIVLGYDGGARVLRQGEPVAIDKYRFGFVYLAFRTIELDNGAHHVNRIAGETVVDLDTFYMPWAYGVEKLAMADNALQRLTEQGRSVYEEFLVGEESRQFEIMRNNEGLETAHSLVNDWFNGDENGRWANTPTEAA